MKPIDADYPIPSRVGPATWDGQAVAAGPRRTECELHEERLVDSDALGMQAKASQWYFWKSIRLCRGIARAREENMADSGVSGGSCVETLLCSTMEARMALLFHRGRHDSGSQGSPLPCRACQSLATNFRPPSFSRPTQPSCIPGFGSPTSRYCLT